MPGDVTPRGEKCKKNNKIKQVVPRVTPPVFSYMSDWLSEPLSLLLFDQDGVHLLLALSGNVSVIVF